eukprot:SAG11_NODE_162_length_13962_cov_19.035562_1_plen_78_part_00
MPPCGAYTPPSLLFKNLVLHPDASNRHTLQVSTRVKSLSALLIRPQIQNLSGNKNCHSVSVDEGCGIKDYKFKIGSI